MSTLTHQSGEPQLATTTNRFEMGHITHLPREVLAMIAQEIHDPLIMPDQESLWAHGQFRDVPDLGSYFEYSRIEARWDLFALSATCTALRSGVEPLLFRSIAVRTAFNAR